MYGIQAWNLHDSQRPRRGVTGVNTPTPSEVTDAHTPLCMCLISDYLIRGMAPSDSQSTDDSESDSCLGLVPHQVT